MKKFRIHHSGIWTFGALFLMGPIFATVMERTLWARTPLAIAFVVSLIAGVALTWAAFFGSSVVVDSEGIEVRSLRGHRFIGHGKVSYLHTFIEGSGKYKKEGVVIRLIGGEEIRLELTERDEMIAAVREGQRDFADEEERRENARRTEKRAKGGYRVQPDAAPASLLEEDEEGAAGVARKGD